MSLDASAGLICKLVSNDGQRMHLFSVQLLSVVVVMLVWGFFPFKIRSIGTSLMRVCLPSSAVFLCTAGEKIETLVSQSACILSAWERVRERYRVHL